MTTNRPYLIIKSINNPLKAGNLVVGLFQSLKGREYMVKLEMILRENVALGVGEVII